MNLSALSFSQQIGKLVQVPARSFSQTLNTFV